MSNVSARIKKFNKGRLKDMLLLKYQFMGQNIFRFYRGTCHLFYEDLSKHKKLPPSPLSWICGDLHLENYGTFKGDDRLVYFDMNDFDEALLAPAAWEIVRMVTSIFIAFEALKINRKEASEMTRLFLKKYSGTLSEGKARYIDRETAKGFVHSFLLAIGKRKPKDLLQKTTRIKKGQLQLITNNNHFAIEGILKKELLAHISDWLKHSTDKYFNYEPIDVVFHVAGTGSVGSKRYVFLLKNTKDIEKYFLLDMKQEFPSSLAPYVKVPQPAWASDAERVIAIQKRMQNVAPALLSATVFKGDVYMLQELQPAKDAIDFRLIGGNHKEVHCTIEDMAVLTASAQLRSSGRQGAAVADELIAFGQNDQWQEKILDYAVAYAKIVKSDYKDFVADLKRGGFN